LIKTDAIAHMLLRGNDKYFGDETVVVARPSVQAG
jgi:hypothetical protein